MIYELHPDIGLRNDIDRNILYVKNPTDSEVPDFVRALSTPASILVALFDGGRALDEAVRIWSDLIYDKSPDWRVSQEIEAFLQTDILPDLKVKDIFRKGNKIDRAATVLSDIRKLIVERSKVNLDDPRLRIPLRMVFIPTLKCTQSCYYCYGPEPGDATVAHMPLRRVRQIFSEAKNLGIDYVDISGGEPFAYPEWFQLLEVLHDLEVTPNIPTKYPLTRKDVRRLDELGIKSIQVSIDAINRELLEYSVGVIGYAERIARSFRYLEEMGIKLRINTVVTPLNMEDIANLIHFLTSFGNIYRINLSPYERSRFRHSDRYYVPPKQYSELVKKLEDVLADFSNIRFSPGEPSYAYSETNPANKEEAWRERSFCTGGRHSFVLLPDGKVTICEELYYHPHYLMGDLSEQSIMEMWNSEDALRVLHPNQEEVPGGPCRRCAEFEECHLFPGRCVRETVKAYGRQRHYFPDPRCPKAPEVQESVLRLDYDKLAPEDSESSGDLGIR